VLGGIESMVYAIMLIKPGIESLSLLACSSIGPSSGYFEGPNAAARAQGNTPEAGNSFYGLETMDLICFRRRFLKV
jgi:hypothetical protein